MRTLIAPLAAGGGVESCARSTAGEQQIARRYIRRLALEPYLGARHAGGARRRTDAGGSTSTATTGPSELFGARHPAPRRGDEDLGEGAAVADRVLAARGTAIQSSADRGPRDRRGHTATQPDAYELASAGRALLTRIARKEARR